MGVDLFGTERANPTSLLTTLALINVNWESHRRSYLDNFQPFVLEALRTNPSLAWDDATARDQLAAMFGLLLPTRVVGSLLKRCAQQGMATREHNRYVLTTQGRSAGNPEGFAALQSNCRRQQRSLASSLARLANERFDLPWSEDSAESALATYIEAYAVPLLASSTRGDAVDVLDRSAGQEYVVSVFVADIVRRDPEKFRYLDEMVKGSMLASALYLDVQADVDRKFARTTLYLDTPILLKTLGFEGPDPELAGRQVLEMVLGQGAALGCFEHTLREVTGVLDSAKNSLLSGTQKGDEPGVLSYLRSTNAAASDVDLSIARLEAQIRGLGVSILPTPAYANELGIDETALEDLLQKRVGYAHRGARVADVNSLYSVHRARHGSAPRQLERCKAVLVTDNERLVSAAREFFDRQAHGWPLAMLENDLAALAWVKEPQRYPDLPRAQVIADCIAAHLPSQPLWTKVTEEIERLQSRGEINEADIAILRFSHGASQAIMDATLGEPERATSANILAALESAKREVQAPIMAERDDAILRAGNAELVTTELQERTQELESERVDALRQASELTAKVEALAAEVVSAKDVETRLRRQASARAQTRTRHFRLGAYGMCGTLVALAIWTAFPEAGPPLPPWATWGARAAGAMGLLTGVFGSIPEMVRRIERWLSPKLEGRILRQMGFLD